ncbi:TIGR01841 family phasin [Caballeronia insecticola]|uniref:Phasin n=2 Tax=Burkholderiaceae TaxID=119060 RepID=R4WPV0_9BURK|nr:TIGR01841 family phasin [Caballeronia insecticola]BAN26698.1 phasin [Caballeronia insecticola]BAW99837.1 PHA-associated protein [Burkholderia sp. RPE75]
MFPFFSQQTTSIPATGLQTFVNVSKRYASGLQQIADLNVQTIKTVFEEGNAVFRAGPNAKPADMLSWQSTLFAEAPEKAAAYTRHFLEIVRSTQTDMFNEARAPLAQAGAGMKQAFESATPVALFSNAKQKATHVADEAA